MRVLPVDGPMPSSVVGLALTVFMMAGCAAFPANRVPKLNGIVSPVQISTKPTICLEVRYMVVESRGDKPVDVLNQRLRLRQMTDKVIKEAALFPNHTFDSSQAKDMDYVLQMEMTNYGTHSTTSAVITGLTLYIVPTAATDNYKLTAKLFDHDGNLLRSYSYDDGITTWIGIWFLPMVGNTPASAAQGVWENMIRTLFRDILNDNLLSYS